jgi:hypothetical protein
MAFFESDDRKQRQDIGFKKGVQKCLVCGRLEDWHCRVREDEKIGLCKYTPNKDDRTDSIGRYIHHFDSAENDGLATARLANDVPRDVEEQDISIEHEDNLKDDDRQEAVYLNAVYERYLEGLILESNHKQNLVSRGLSDREIKSKGYKSVPNYRARHTQIEDLVTDYDLKGVAGFYKDEQGWCINMTFPAFYVPYRDVDGNIVGLQLRCDDDRKQKYMWFSSGGRDEGTSSGAPFHFVNPDRVRETNEVYLTEGALKADIIGGTGVGLIAMAGVSVVKPKNVSKAIYDNFPDISRIFIAFDTDWKTNPNVKSALLRLCEELQDSVVDVQVAVWDESLGKGLDDVLINQDYQEDSVKYIPVEYFLKAENGAGGDEPPPPVETETDDEESEDFVYRWDEFSRLNFSNTDRVIFGLVRGNVGLVVAPTNIGKTTYCLNLALSATTKREFSPMLNKEHSVKRVLYVDGEATKAELQADIKRMLNEFDEIERESVAENLFLVCDEELDYDPLDLVNPVHIGKIQDAALKSSADLIIIDTLAALMDVSDENDNAVVKKEVMKPLRILAKKANAAVLLLHHSGKYYEGAPQGVNRGRGASTIPALARAVFNMERDDSGNNRVSLSCSKVKGEIFQKTLLELNPESRWFSVRGIAERQDESDNSYKQVVEYVCKAGKIVTRADVLTALESDELSRATIDRKLDEAISNRDLEKAGHGKYKCSNTQHNSQELALDE